MAQLKHTVNKAPKDLAKAEPEGGPRYAGKTPPKDVYKGVLKQFGVRMMKGKPQKNKNGDFMLKGLVEISEPEKSRKAKYNGYPIWFNLNVSDQGAPYVNQMLDAMSGGSEAYRAAFWEKFVVIDEKGLATRVGKSRYADGTVEVVVSAKDEYDQSNNRKLTVGAFLLSTSSSDEDDEDDEDNEDDIDVDVEDDEAESEFESEDEDEEESEDEDEEESEDDEDEEEEEEDDEDEVEVDPSEARAKELATLSRVELVKIAKSLSVKTAKSKTEDDYIKEIIAVEFSEEDDDEPPF